jgi:hypothetical protein
MLKAVAERCIDSVFRLRTTCPDWPSLVVYYQNAAVLPRDLAVRKRVIGSIQRMREEGPRKAGERRRPSGG